MSANLELSLFQSLYARLRKAISAVTLAGVALSGVASAEEGRTGSFSRPGHAMPTIQAQPAGYATGMHIPIGQSITEPARAMHHLIEAMPNSSEELEIIERRSQLIKTRQPLMKAAIADPSVIDVVQYGPREFSLVGLGRGSTTLTMWFEDTPDPLIYLIKVVRDPNLDLQRKIDYGKLEKKLAVLFPNSKVYLIPMTNKVIVRGQARDSEEAAHILELIRGEVLNHETFTNANAAGGAGVVPWIGNGGAFANMGYGGYGGYGGGVYGAGGYGGYGGGFGGGFGGLGDGFNGLIVNELRVPGEFMVSVTTRVAKIDRGAARRAGVDISAVFANGRQAVSSAAGGAGGNLSGVFENGEIGIFLNYLTSNGTATILAEPTLTVLSGRPARFLSGGDYAVPTTVGVNGVGAASTSFRGFGTSLLVTPTVLDRDLIRMQIQAAESHINEDNSVNGIFGTNGDQISTTVEMREGQTLGLAGMYANRKNTVNQRIPWLGDIPHVGPLLFTQKRSTMEDTELLILVTPELVRAMDPHEVPPVPGQEVTWPTDHEFYKYNIIEGSPDTGHYNLPPYGSGATGTNVGYQHFNPGPAAPMYPPSPTQQSGGMGGFSVPQSAVPPLSRPVESQQGRLQTSHGPSIRAASSSSAPQSRGSHSAPGTRVAPIGYSGSSVRR